MSKLTKYESFKELKSRATTNTVNVAVLMERQKKFENIVYFLRGEDPKDQSELKNKEVSTN